MNSDRVQSISPNEPTPQAEPQEKIVSRSRGTGQFIDPTALERTDLKIENTSGTVPEGDTYIYRNAPIDAVVNDILSESYGLSFIVDPNVRGEITLRLENIRSQEQAISALASALELQGFELAQEADTYLVTRAGTRRTDEEGRVIYVRQGQALPQGTNFAVIEISRARAADLTDAIGAMGYQDVIRANDDARGLITLAGSPQRVEDALSLLRAFDVDWLSAVSTALVPLLNSTPDDLLAELEPVFARTGGLEFIALPRLNALLVLGNTDARIDEALIWIERLDADIRSAISNKTLIYEARFLDAEQLLQAVKGLFGDERTSFAGSLVRSQQNPDRPQTTVQNSNNQIGNLRVAIDQSRNAILARGDTDELNELSDLLGRLDSPQPQILIEATIVEVTLTDDLRFGVQWDAVEDQLRTTFTDATGGGVSSRFPGVSVSYVDTNIQAVLNALANVSDVEIVSSPRVTTLNNLPARLQVGDQVPVITQSAVSVTDPGSPLVNSVSFRDTGVILDVTPRARGGGMIEVQVSQEVSGVAETTTSGIDSPTITQRRIESTLVVPDGSTAVLGGLISSTRSLTETGVPVLKDIPGVGRLFSATGQNERRTELVVLIRPTLISEDQPVQLNLSERLQAAVLRVRPELFE